MYFLVDYPRDSLMPRRPSTRMGPVQTQPMNSRGSGPSWVTVSDRPRPWLPPRDRPVVQPDPVCVVVASQHLPRRALPGGHGAASADYMGCWRRYECTRAASLVEKPEPHVVQSASRWSSIEPYTAASCCYIREGRVVIFAAGLGRAIFRLIARSPARGERADAFQGHQRRLRHSADPRKRRGQRSETLSSHDVLSKNLSEAASAGS